LEAKEALEAIKGWTEKACAIEASKDCPDITALCFLIRKPAIHRVSVKSDLHKGHKLIEFDIDAPGNAGRKTRYMLPVHFAITRLLELIPDVRLCIISKGKKDDRYYYMTIRYPPKFRKAHDLRDANRLERIIFNAPPNAVVSEQRNGDYQCIAPSEYMLAKNRGDDKQNAERWLGISQSVFGTPGDPLRDLPKVMRKLFVIAERWHWEELAGRLPDDPRISL
jgi:hypothetical protein